MLKPVKQRQYTTVPFIYSSLMKDVNYRLWREYIYELSHVYVDKNPSVLELSAGTCRLANSMLRYYKNIIASDISSGMLKQDKKRKVLKVCCDMQKLPFNISFDLIYSTFDSVNYITSQSKLLKFFRGIKSALKPGGIFTFDVSLEKNSYRHQKSHIKQGKQGSYTFKRESRYLPKSRVHKNIFYITDRKGNSYTETHIQKIYPFELYFFLLDKAGLQILDCLDIFTLRRGKPGSYRVQFIVRKGDE